MEELIRKRDTLLVQGKQNKLLKKGVQDKCAGMTETSWNSKEGMFDIKAATLFN